MRGNTDAPPTVGRDMDESEVGILPWWSWAGAAVAVVAVLLEFARVTQVWPSAARSSWWVFVTLALTGYHVGRWRTGEKIRIIPAALTVAAFATFTVGVILATEWAAWH